MSNKLKNGNAKKNNKSCQNLLKQLCFNFNNSTPKIRKSSSSLTFTEKNTNIKNTIKNNLQGTVKTSKKKLD